MGCAADPNSIPGFTKTQFCNSQACQEDTVKENNTFCHKINNNHIF